MGLFSTAPQIGFAFAISKVIALNLYDLLLLIYIFVRWFMAFFSYYLPYNYRSSNDCDSNSCRCFSLLKTIAKSKGKRSPSPLGAKKKKHKENNKAKKQRTDTK